MNRLLIPALFLILPAIAQLEGQEKPTLDSLKLEFDVNRAELRKPIKELQTRYDEQLGQLLEKVTAAGELKKVLAVKAEIDGYKDGKPEPADDSFPELKRLQGIYADAHAQRVATMNKELGTVVAGYKAKLLALQKELTKENKIEDALAVSAVVAGIKAEILPTAPKPSASGSLPRASEKEPFENSLGMKFAPVRIYGGKSSMKKIFFSIWETRVKDYRAFVQGASHKPTGATRFKQGDDHPVVLVSQSDAKEFCNWLTKKERAEKIIGPEDEYRLPTDHEWSCAVGIGRKEDADEPPMAKNRKVVDVYPWGNEWPPPEGAGNFLGEDSKDTIFGANGTIADYIDGFPYTAPVGSFAPNPFGLFDMGGNACEWCDDWVDPVKKQGFIFRDGGWRHRDSSTLLSSSRQSGPPFDHIGFRCVLEVGEEN